MAQRRRIEVWRRATLDWARWRRSERDGGSNLDRMSLNCRPVLKLLQHLEGDRHFSWRQDKIHSPANSVCSIVSACLNRVNCRPCFVRYLILPITQDPQLE